jgi:hypothetical protein
MSENMIGDIGAVPINPEVSNQKMLTKFAEIQKKLFNNQIYLYVHGTSPDNVEDILNRGLKCKKADITHTAMNMTSDKLSQDSIDKINNWPHYEYKHLIMIGIPFNARIYMGNPQAEPIWRPIKKGDNYDDGSISSVDGFLIPKELIVGYVDVENNDVILNSEYQKDFDKNELQVDHGINPVDYEGEYIPEFDTNTNSK